MKHTARRLRAALFGLIRENSLCIKRQVAPCPWDQPCGCRLELQARLAAASDSGPEIEAGLALVQTLASRPCDTRGCGVHIRCDDMTCPLGLRRPVQRIRATV
jgi:hypothetical protein